MASNPTLSNLAASWQFAVQTGKIVNHFEALSSESEHRWHAGDRLQFGLRLHKGKPTYFATNITTGNPIELAVEERLIPDTDFIRHFNGYRSLRPGGTDSYVGRQPQIGSAPTDCRFYCQCPQHPLSLRAREPLAELPLCHYCWKFYYNAF